MLTAGAARWPSTQMHDYGALFLGERTCVSYGDKVIGTNHVLPTGRGALHRRPVGGQVPEDRHLPGGHRPASSAALGELCGRASRVELFEGHARSGDVRAWRHHGDTFGWIEAALGQNAALADT